MKGSDIMAANSGKSLLLESGVPRPTGKNKESLQESQIPTGSQCCGIRTEAQVLMGGSESIFDVMVQMSPWDIKSLSVQQNKVNQ